MRRVFFLSALLIFWSQLLFGQVPDSSKWFDFWIGDWEVSWEEGDSLGRGANTITATLDGTVIQENFRIHTGQSKGFKGTSIFVFDPRAKTWHQAWADNQGGYFDFTGELQGENRVFKTDFMERGDVRMLYRMGSGAGLSTWALPLIPIAWIIALL